MDQVVSNADGLGIKLDINIDWDHYNNELQKKINKLAEKMYKESPSLSIKIVEKQMDDFDINKYLLIERYDLKTTYNIREYIDENSPLAKLAYKTGSYTLEHSTKYGIKGYFTIRDYEIPTEIMHAKTIEEILDSDFRKQYLYTNPSYIEKLNSLIKEEMERYWTGPQNPVKITSAIVENSGAAESSLSGRKCCCKMDVLLLKGCQCGGI